MKSTSVSWKCCVAAVVLATGGLVGGRASADYIATLNTIAGPDRISLWRLGETSGNTAADSWGAGTLDGANVGTYTDVGLGAAGPSSATGHIGFGDTNNAIQFTGAATQLLQMADAASFDGVGALTMTLWFNIPSNLATNDPVQRYFGGLSDSTNLASGRYGFAFNSGAAGANSNSARVRGFVRLGDTNDVNTELTSDSGNGGVLAPSGPSNYRDGNWHMLTMTMGDNGADKEFEIYVDGLSRFTGSLAGGAGMDLATRHTGASTGVLAFGADLGDLSRLFNGHMDEISFIGRRLSDGEVGDLYASAFLPVVPAPSIPEPSTVALGGLALLGALVVRRRLAG
jgi:hypothetical protein